MMAGHAGPVGRGDGGGGGRAVSRLGLGRCLWTLLAAAHAPALLSVYRAFATSGFDVAHLGGCIALSLAMLFFALKIYGVSSLRMPSHPRAWVAMCLIVALVHVDVLRPRTPAAVVPQCVTIVATAMLFTGLPRRVGRHLGTALARVGSVLRCRLHMTRSTETVWFDALRPHCWVLASRLFVLRAPPL